MADIFNQVDLWNAAGTVFTAVKMNVTDTASATGSLLMDLQVGGVSKFGVGKAGTVTIAGPVSGVLQIGTYDDGGACFRVGNTSSTYFVFDVGFNGLFVGSAYHIGFSSNTNPNVAGTDVRLYRDAANTLAQRNGTAAQTFNLYSTFTDASNYERLSITSVAGSYFQIGPQGAGTGAARQLILTGAGLTGLTIGGTAGSWNVQVTTGHLLPGTDNSVDIGSASSASRYIRAATSLITNGAAVTVNTPTLNLAQTWNNVATTFTGALLNVTDTTSAAGSLLMDLQVGGVSKFKVDKTGIVGNGITYSPRLDMGVNGSGMVYVDRVDNQGVYSVGFGYDGTTRGLTLHNAATVRWSATATANAASDLSLLRDAANTLAQRNGVNAQAFNLYSTYTDASNYARLAIKNSAAADFTIATEKAGTGVFGSIFLTSDAGGSVQIGANLFFSGGTIGFNGTKTQTVAWNNVGTTFTGYQLNVTDTASAAGSLLMDLQVGGVSKFNVSKTGAVVAAAGGAGVSGFYVGGSTANGIYAPSTSNFYLMASGGAVAEARGGGIGLGGNTLSWGTLGAAQDLIIARDAANTLAQRNGVNAQTFNLYNTYTDASNYERGFMRFTTNQLIFGSEAAGTGTVRIVQIKCGTALGFQIDGNGTNLYNPAGNALLWRNGGLLSSADNSVDIGAAGSDFRYVRAASALVTKPLTVATLPAAATALAGARSFVTDSTLTAAGNFGAAVVGGGTSKVPVYSDGAGWYIG